MIVNFQKTIFDRKDHQNEIHEIMYIMMDMMKKVGKIWICKQPNKLIQKDHHRTKIAKIKKKKKIMKQISIHIVLQLYKKIKLKIKIH